MTDITLTPTRFQNGLWEGLITAGAEPQIEALYLAEPVPDVTLTHTAQGWVLRVPVPLTALSDGVHTVIIVDAQSRERLGDITIIAGSPAAESLQAEVALLRAELDMLKQVVRRALSADS